jgi:hypothetical protein
MAIVVESTTTAPFATGSTSFVQNRPTGTADGDLLVAFVFTGEDNGTTDLTVTGVPAGWSLVRAETTIDAGSGNNPAYVYVYSKIASSEPASWTWTLSSSDSSLWYAGAVMRVSGAMAITDSDDATVSNSPTPAFTGGVTPAGVNNLLFMATIATGVSSSATTVSGYAITTSNPSWTELLDSQNDTVGSTLLASIAYATRSQDTATGNWTLTYSTGSAMDSASQLFCITEPVNGTGTFEHLAIEPVLFKPIGESGTTGTHAHIEVEPILHKPNKVTSVNPRWTDQEKPATPTWANQER